MRCLISNKRVCHDVMSKEASIQSMSVRCVNTFDSCSFVVVCLFSHEGSIYMYVWMLILRNIGGDRLDRTFGEIGATHEMSVNDHRKSLTMTPPRVVLLRSTFFLIEMQHGRW